MGLLPAVVLSSSGEVMSGQVNRVLSSGINRSRTEGQASKSSLVAVAVCSKNLLPF